MGFTFWAVKLLQKFNCFSMIVFDKKFCMDRTKRVLKTEKKPKNVEYIFRKVSYILTLKYMNYN